MRAIAPVALAAGLLAALVGPAGADSADARDEPSSAPGDAVAGVTSRADPCWVSHRRGPYPACFDPGNRLHLDAASDGFGGAIQLRHHIPVEDPEVSWRLEHQLAAVRVSGEAVRGSLYTGRLVRHSADGHLVLPFGRPRKLFLPFDIGAEMEVGSLRARADSDAVSIGAVRTGALLELSRSGSFRRRFSIGPVARWDFQLDRASWSATEHRVAPFSLGALDLRAESRNGLTIASLRGEAGGTWSTESGWRRWLGAEVELERVFMAVQDRPVSVFVGGAFAAEDESLSGLIGLRFAPLVRVPARGSLAD